MTVLLYVALFGATGCLARYFLSGWVDDLIGPALPYGTLAVNGIGAFLIGLVMEFSLRTAQENVDRLMPRINEMMSGGLITVEKVTVTRYTHRHEG